MIRDLVDYCFKRLDIDRDGRITFGDFSAAVGQENLLLELLGPCFPGDRVKAVLLSPFVLGRPGISDII